MTAQLIQFPKAKKRGAKVRKGPLCDFHDIAPAPAPKRVVGSDNGMVNRLVDKVEEAMSDPTNRLGAMLRERFQEDDRKKVAQFEMWRDGELMSAKEYASRSRFGSATDHFGEGPDAFRWAVRDANGHRLQSPWQRDQALALAIECLNTVAHAVRYGAIGPSVSGCLRGDEGAGEAYAQGVLSTLGRTIGLLKEFGAGADPA